MSKLKTNERSKPIQETDLPDSEHDRERLENEEVTLNLPEVKDIPGQEFIHTPPPSEFADTTISSADEEGDDVLGDEEEITDESSSVSETERSLLDASANDMPTKDELALRRAALDSVDDDGEPLNEKTSANAISGSDLDVPGADDDDENEELGEEDEENNPYSLGGDDQSINEERSGT
jgi:hypothetical protein